MYVVRCWLFVYCISSFVGSEMERAHLCCRLRAMQKYSCRIWAKLQVHVWLNIFSLVFSLYSLTFRWRIFLIWYSKHAGVFHIYITCHSWQQWETRTNQIGNCNVYAAIGLFFSWFSSIDCVISINYYNFRQAQHLF